MSTPIKAYLSIDDLTTEEIPMFQELASELFVEYSLINIVNDKRFYIGLMRDSSQISTFIDAIRLKNPSIIGVFLHSGLMYGLTNDEILGVIGTVTYPFKADEFLSLMPDESTYGPDGAVLSIFRPTTITPLKNFGGWKPCIFN